MILLITMLPLIQEVEVVIIFILQGFQPFTLKTTDSSDLFTLYNSSDEISVQFDDKVLVLGSLDTAPTPVTGGLFYSGSDEWFLGYEN